MPEGNGRWSEYAGGYSDMLAQRGADLTREQRKPEPPKAAKAAAAAVAPPAREAAHDLQGQARAGNAAEDHRRADRRSRRLQAKLADPQFYPRDRAGFEKVTTDLGEIQRKMAAAEEQWLAARNPARGNCRRLATISSAGSRS